MARSSLIASHWFDGKGAYISHFIQIFRFVARLIIPRQSKNTY